MQRCMAQDNPEERRKAAMQDPEVQAILADPAMQMILQQMQTSPEAIRECVEELYFSSAHLAEMSLKSGYDWWVGPVGRD